MRQSDPTREPQGSTRLIFLSAIASGTLLNPLNSSMIAVALVDLSRSFRLTFADVSWVISVYYVASAIGQPLNGRLGDLYGRRRMFLSGLLVVGLASALAPLTTTFPELLCVRVVQALGGSALFPSAIAIIRSTVFVRQARALGVLAVASSLSAAIGPTIGGYLVGWDGWHGIFLVNIPLVAFAWLAGVLFLPHDPPRVHVRPATALRRVDPIGAVLFAATLASILWFIVTLERAPAWWTLPLIPAGAAAFIAVERRVADPFLDVRGIAANPPLVFVYGQFVLVNVVSYSFFFGVPSFLQAAKGLSPERAGLVMLSVGGVGVVTTPLAARVIEARGVRPALVFGACSMTAATAALLLIRSTTPTQVIAPLLMLEGLSGGFTTLSLQAAMVRHAPAQWIGTASGLFQTSRYLGTIAAASLLALAFGSHIDARRLHLLAESLIALSAAVVLMAMRPQSPSRTELDGDDPLLTYRQSDV